MGPPLKAAENTTGTKTGLDAILASMGPPLKAAENAHDYLVDAGASNGFNGAAAKSSGKFTI